MAAKPKKIVAVVSEFNDLLQEIKAVEAQLEVLKSRKRSMSDALVQRFSDEGVEKLGFDTDDGPRNASLYKVMYARMREGVDTEEALKALRKNGLGDLIKESWNASTLSAWFREQDREGKSVPAGLDAVFSAEPNWEVRVTKG